MHTTKPRNKFQCNIFLVYQAEGETKGSHLFQLFFKKDIAIALSCPSLHVELLEYNLRDNLHCVFLCTRLRNATSCAKVFFCLVLRF